MANTPLKTVGNSTGTLWTRVAAATNAPTSPAAQPQVTLLTLSGSPTAGAAAVAQVVTSTFTGTPSTGQQAVVGVTVTGGVPGALDYYEIKLGGAKYAVRAPGTATQAQVATALAATVTSGSSDSWNLTYTGSAKASDTVSVTISGTAYAYTVIGTKTAAQVAAGLAALIHGHDANYDAVAVGAVLLLTASTAGTGGAKTITTVTTSALSLGLSAVHVIPAVAASGDWTAAASGPVVALTATLPGPQPSVVTTATQPGYGTPVLSALTSVPGVAGDVFTLQLGVNNYQYPCADGNTLQDCLDGLVTAVNADDPVWGVARDGDTLVSTNGTAGVTTSQVVSSVQSGLADASSSDEITTPGTDLVAPGTYAVTDGTTLYTTPTTGVPADDAASLAVLIGGDYTATSADAVITVSAAGGAVFKFTDASTGGGVVTPALYSPATQAQPDTVTGLTAGAANCTVYSQLVAGTSFKQTIWGYDAVTNSYAVLVAKSGALTASGYVHVDTRGVDGLYVELSDFAGSAVVTVRATGN